MTIQNLFIADLGDILRVQLECGACGAQAFHTPTGKTDVPRQCPQCREEWRATSFGDIETGLIEGFLDALKRLREAQEPKEPRRRVTVRLAFDMAPAAENKC